MKGEWRLPTAPFSVFAKYQGSETKYDSWDFINFDAKTTDQRVLLGVKLHMGDKTLQQTDRTGATLDIVEPARQSDQPGDVLSLIISSDTGIRAGHILGHHEYQPGRREAARFRYG